MPKAYIGLGSNVGDRREHLTAAVKELAATEHLTGGSPIYVSAPIGPVEQEPFENAVVAIETDKSARELFERLIAIETSRGRIRTERWGPRTLDLDLLWYDGTDIDEPDLVVPHREIRNRRFVLAPLVYLAPQLADSTGPFVDALPAVADQSVRRVTGPLDRRGLRWRAGLVEALDLRREADDRYSIDLAHDWVNRSGAMFGGFLGSAVLFAASQEHPEKVPTTMTYRYVKPVPEGRRAELRIVHERRTERSALMAIDLTLDDEIYGAAHLSVVADRGETRFGARAPDVMPIDQCIPVDEIIGQAGGEPGNSVESWRPLERWDIPDLGDGSSDYFRAWCPNPVEGNDNPYAVAAAMFMPIDALIWPAAMRVAGRLDHGPSLFTPTVEITARFADTQASDGWHLGESWVDHMSTKSVAGSVRVFTSDGVHAATGHSLNLTIG